MLKETGINIGFFLSEPVTVLTNLFICITCLFFYSKIRRSEQKDSILIHWMFFFLWIGISALIGGIHHGLKYHFPQSTQVFVKLSVNLSSLPASYHLLILSIIISPISIQQKEILQRFSFWLILLLVPITIFINEFYLVKIIAGLIILLSIATHLYNYRKQTLIGSGMIAYGFLFSLSSIVVHSTKFSLSEWFNFKDISHVIMNVSLLIIFLGAWKYSKQIQHIENQVKKH